MRKIKLIDELMAKDFVRVARLARYRKVREDAMQLSHLKLTEMIIGTDKESKKSNYC